MKKSTFIFIIIFFIRLLGTWPGGLLSAQVMVNYGAVIYSNNDTIYANGGIRNDSLAGIGGTFRNSGSLYIHNGDADPGDWINDAGNSAFTNTAGANGGSNITVFMVGGNQNIGGTDVTEFYNLDLQGTGVKQLVNKNTIIRNTLNLNDREFATGIYQAYVTNTAVPSVQLTSGFVSSSNGGALVRSTAANQAYLFPVGSSLSPARYRPVEITPDDNSPNDYAVRFANLDPGIETYNVGTKKSTVSNVNPYYYHQIRRDAGSTPASITMYYDPADGDFTGMGHWQGPPQWEDIASAPSGSQFGLSAMNAPSWDFSSPSSAFSLIKLLNECGEVFVPNAFSPDNNGENDMECVYGKCIKSLTFAIYDRWGEKVFETDNKDNCWDGVYKGKKMNTAVFVYYLRVTLNDGDEVIKKGNISLFR